MKRKRKEQMVDGESRKRRHSTEARRKWYALHRTRRQAKSLGF